MRPSTGASGCCLPVERESLIRLSAIPGSFDRELALATLAGIALDPDGGVQTMIDGLIVRSLVVRRGVDRFVLLQTIRDFARHQQRADEAHENSLRIASHFAGQADVFDLERTGPRQQTWLEFSRREIENVRKSLRWSVANGRQDLVLRIATGMVLHWASSGYFLEGLDWIERGLAMGGDLDPAMRMRALARAGYLARFEAHSAKAGAYLEEALLLAETVDDIRERCEILDQLGDHAHDNPDYDRARALQLRLIEESQALADKSLEAIGYCGLGLTDLFLGDIDRARDHIDRAYEIALSAQDRRRLARVLVNLGVVLRYQNELELAEERYAEAEQIYRELGEKSTVLITALNRSELALSTNQLERCQVLSGEVIAGAREVGDRRVEGIATANLGLATLKLGRDREGFQTMAEAASMLLSQGSKPMVIEIVNVAATEYAERGEMERAVTILGAAAKFAAETGSALPEQDQAAVRHAVESCRAALGADAVDKATKRGANMAIADVIRLVAGLPDGDPTSGQPDTHSGAASISVRERDVLRLVAEGLTDQQIADQLFLSKRTVSTHVANILDELDVDSRTAAASVAIRQGLIA